MVNTRIFEKWAWSCIYTCNFCTRFHIKLAHLVTKKIFITKRASFVRNRPQNHANVNDPIKKGDK